MMFLMLIPARGGSKRIANKNIKPFYGRPLIYYTLDAALQTAKPEDICISSDSEEIISVVKEYGLKIPFRRPDSLATDTAASYDVILHAVEYYEGYGVFYDAVVLLQPTSPFRNALHIREAISLFEREAVDMVVSVRTAKVNPYFSLFEEDKDGFLFPSKKGDYSRFQDCPAVYEYNGAIYVMNTLSLKKGPPASFSKIRKYVMSEEESLDIDSELDWIIAEAVFPLIRDRIKI